QGRGQTKRTSTRFNGATARTRWRARARARGAVADPVRASMGPPRERGGEPAGTRPRAPSSVGFNGATARTRWRASLGRGSLPATLRFNGATARTRWRGPSFGPRPPPSSTLQWGHRANAVESSGHLHRHAGARLPLQWGHRANAVERLVSPRAGSRF